MMSFDYWRVNSKITGEMAGEMAGADELPLFINEIHPATAGSWQSNDLDKWLQETIAAVKSYNQQNAGQIKMLTFYRWLNREGTHTIYPVRQQVTDAILRYR